MAQELVLFKDILKDAQKSVDGTPKEKFCTRYPKQQDAARRAYERIELSHALQAVSKEGYYHRFELHRG